MKNLEFNEKIEDDFSFTKFTFYLILIIVIGYFILFICFWVVFGTSIFENIDVVTSKDRLKAVDVVLEFLDRFCAMIALLSAGIILALVAKYQAKNTDSWQWLSCGFLFLGIWSFNNVTRSFVKDIGDFSEEFRENNPIYIFIQLFDHTFELFGAILLGFWLVKLYRQVIKRKEPPPGSLSSFLIVLSGGLMLHSFMFLILTSTGLIQDVIDGGEVDFILDKLENIIVGPLMLTIGIFAFLIIFRMVEKSKAWILTGLGFISYGIDRTFMDLFRSFVEDKIIVPFLNLKIGVSLFGLEPITKDTVPPNIIYWFFEFGDHYWTAMTLILIIGTGMLYQEFSTGYKIKPSYLLLLEEELSKKHRPKSSINVVPVGEGIPYTLENLLKARELLAKQVTERTRDLLREKQRIETIMSTIPNALLVLDVTGSLYLTNNRFKDLFHNVFQKSLSPNFNIFDHPDHILFNEVKSFMKSKSNIKIQKKVELGTIEPIKRLHKQIHIKNIIIPAELQYEDVVIPGERLGVIIEFRDVSKFIEFDNLRKQFVSTVSHELRTPITAIDLSIKNLIEYSEKLSEDMTKELMNTIAQNSTVLNEMIADLLLISRVESGRFELQPSSYSLNEVLSNVIDLFEPKRALKELDIQVNVDPSITLLGDPKRINQIFRILIDNAIKYTPEKGFVRIKTFDNYQGKYNPKEFDGVLIQFTDSGIGIRETDLPHLFERFFRTDNARDIQGTGLGLSIAKELASLHNGDIFVESEYKKGSTFSVFLPRISYEEFKKISKVKLKE